MLTKFRFRKFKTEMEMHGVISAIRLSLRFVFVKLLSPKYGDFDKTYGTVTNERVEVSDGDIPPEAFDTAVCYLPTSPKVIGHICRTLPIRYEDCRFLDLGSGRGRALILAADFPFKEINWSRDLTTASSDCAEKHLYLSIGTAGMHEFQNNLCKRSRLCAAV